MHVMDDRLRHIIEYLVKGGRHELGSLLLVGSSVNHWVLHQHVLTNLEQLLLGLQLAFIQVDVVRKFFAISLQHQVVSFFEPLVDWDVLKAYKKE